MTALRRGEGRIVLTLMVSATLSACGSSDETPPSVGSAACRDLAPDTIASLAWSQTGAYLAVGTSSPDGEAAGLIVTWPGFAIGDEVVDQAAVPGSAVVTAAGRLAWLREHQSGRSVVEDLPEGRRRTALPPGVTLIRWTAIGYAAVVGSSTGSRVLLIDPARPSDPSVLYETRLRIEQLWISADPEWLLLTVADTAASEEPIVVVVGPERTVTVPVPDLDWTGASMPALRRKIVYRSQASGEMLVVRVDEPRQPTPLFGEPTRLGAVSDKGVLAVGMARNPGELCIVDVSARLR